MKTAQKVLFTDLDGTLLDDEKQISGENRKCIEQAVAMGHKVVLSSGRAAQSVYKQVRKLRPPTFSSWTCGSWAWSRSW